MPKVMVIDDDAALRRGLSIRLGSAGFDVLTAENPDAALPIVLRERPDLILLDIDMPHYSGLEFQQSLQVTRRGREIPIIYLSGRGTPPNRQDAFRQGARAFLTKPYDPGELLATVRGVLAASAPSATPQEAQAGL